MRAAVRPDRLSQRPTDLLWLSWLALAGMYVVMSFIHRDMPFLAEQAWWLLLLFPVYPAWRNRRGLDALSVSASSMAFHQGQPGRWCLQVANPGSFPVGELVLSWNMARKTTQIPSRTTQPVDLDVSYLARGVHAITQVSATSLFPFGLFSSSKRLQVSAVITVYPALELAAPPWPSSTDPMLVSRTGDEIVAFRDYISGDPLSTVDWKLSARRDQLVVRQFEPPHPAALVFSLDQVSDLPLEQGLSRLATWIVRAASQGLTYALVLGDQRLPIGQGPSHRHACLLALARFHGENK